MCEPYLQHLKRNLHVAAYVQKTSQGACLSQPVNSKHQSLGKKN